MSQSPRRELRLQRYLDGWEIINRMIREDTSWGGRERNCLHLSSGEGNFIDISAASGVDYIQDGRALCRLDLDLDGRPDLALRNRDGPQLRLLRNTWPGGNRALWLRVEGRNCNRDAIGARVELTLSGKETPSRIRTLYAGDGYLSQSSKWVHIGLAPGDSIAQVNVRWPGSRKPELFEGVSAGGRYRLVQGSGRAIAQKRPAAAAGISPGPVTAPELSDAAQIRFSERPAVPKLAYQNLEGTSAPIAVRSGRTLLVNLWATWCAPCLAEMPDLQAFHQQRGDEVRTILTPHALKFITPLTFQAVTQQAVYTDTFEDDPSYRPDHISLPEWADVVVVAPATAAHNGGVAQGEGGQQKAGATAAGRARERRGSKGIQIRRGAPLR